MSEPSSEKNIELQRQMWDRVIQQRSYFLKEALKSHSYKKENIKKHQYRGERKKRKIEIARLRMIARLSLEVDPSSEYQEKTRKMALTGNTATLVTLLQASADLKKEELQKEEALLEELDKFSLSK